jgi:protein-disulfide isomerase
MEQTMKRTNLVSAAILAGVILLAPHASPAQDLRGEIEAIVKDYLATHPDELGQIVKDYFVKHPEAVGQILAELLKHRSAATASAGAPTTPGASANTAGERSTAIASNASQLFASPHQVTLGNPQGDVTLVEFFDYSCGFCKRALPDMLTLLKDNPKLKIVLKEFPILGPGSVDASRVAIAVRMQDPTGEKYLDFHQKLLGGRGHADRASALAAAADAGLDVAQIEKDMDGDEVKKTLEESMTLARTLGLSGTPSYVVGDEVVVGAVGVAALSDRLRVARK